MSPRQAPPACAGHACDRRRVWALLWNDSILPPCTAQATPTERKHIGGSCIRWAQSAAELNVLDTRAYMLERLSLDFATQQQQHKGRKEIWSAFTLPVDMSL